MVKVNIKSGDLRVIGNGSVVHHLEKGELKFTLDDGNESLDFIFEFLEDPNEKANTIKPTLVSPTALRFTYYNHDASIGGTGNNTPVEIGTLSDKHLYLSFYIEGSKTIPIRLINYTWYLGDNTDATN